MRWLRDDLELTVTAFAAPGPGTDGPALVGRYRVRNVGTGVLKATLYLVLRPFQVNPPEQFLRRAGRHRPRCAPSSWTARWCAWTASADW